MSVYQESRFKKYFVYIYRQATLIKKFRNKTIFIFQTHFPSLGCAEPLLIILRSYFRTYLQTWHTSKRPTKPLQSTSVFSNTVRVVKHFNNILFKSPNSQLFYVFPMLRSFLWKLFTRNLSSVRARHPHYSSQSQLVKITIPVKYTSDLL